MSTTSTDYELFCYGKLSNPYPLLEKLRTEEPVHWSSHLESWVITRYDDVLAGLLDPRFGSDRILVNMAAVPESERYQYGSLQEHVSNWLGYTDPPKHTRMRGLIQKVFTPTLAANLRPRIEEIVDGYLKEAEASGKIDFISEFAFRLPTTIICEVLGVPLEMSSEFHRWSDDMVAFTGHIGPSLAQIAGRAHTSQMELDRFFDGLIRDRRESPRDDLLSALAAVHADGDNLSNAELIGLSTFLLVAGHETTVGLISNGLLSLLVNPVQQDLLRENPALVGSAVEEFLRYESPIQFLPRLATSDVEVHGARIKAGQAVILHLGAANRDPERFSNPNSLDIRRAANRHLAFGWGAHFCLGAPLARLEASVAINRVLGRFPEIELATSELHWRENMAIRCLETMMLTL